MQQLLNKEVKPILQEFQAEVIEETVKKMGNRILMRILIDKPSGITIDECAIINRRIGDMIDQKNLITEQYLLEVSSPGLDRSLKTSGDFRRVIGKDIEIWLNRPVSDKVYMTAKVKSVTDDTISIECKDQQELSVPYGAIAKARLLIKA